MNAVATSSIHVSVIIPCFNAARFIAETIESVLAQTYSSFELMVIDDKSTDGSAELVESYARIDPRVRLIRMPKNAGAPAAPRNLGLVAARGEWVAFLDADDLWHPRKLELQMQALNAHSALMCSTQMKDFRDSDRIVFEPPPVPLPIGRVTLTQQLLKYRTPTSSIVASREFMRRHPFNEDPSYKAREDTDCFIRVHEDMPFSIKIIHPLVFYRQQASQISGNKWKMVGRHLAMLKKYRLKSGKGLGAMAYVYTFTHFLASIYLRLIRRML
ncbi:teichuronic acid biosynthesis glycosyltransferase TuaG [Variovorax guangxiensis]|nr:teichuronic acid biosynthesis glycosyltransferase TuaG [Variovorax guangxiensis]